MEYQKLSVVIPFYNEEENVVRVLEEVLGAVPGAEVIAVNDGSRDGTWGLIQQVDGVVGLNLTENRGQSAAMYAGMRRASREFIGLMDGDGQNDPHDFPALLERALDGHGDVICGYRAQRKDTWSRRMASKIANKIRRMFLTDGVRDTGCSVKVFRREAVELLVPFNGLHRYLPAIFVHAQLSIDQVPVNHRVRHAGVSKYSNFERALRGIYDLVGVSWLLKRKVIFPKIEEK